MIRVENMNKKLEKFQLKDISFNLPKGYIMGLIGPNGSGKTSLIHSIIGLYGIDSGSILVCGLDVYEDENRVKNNIGFVLNEDLFTTDMTLEENATFYGNYYNDFELKACKEYCERFCIRWKQKVRFLSKGEKLKFQFAFALAHHPKLLILDEPTESFDPEFREEFIRIITKFVADGEHSVLLATHLMEELEQVSDYITLLNKGKVIFSMEREGLLDSYRMVSGEAYKVNLISKDRLIWKEKGVYATKALVRHSKYATYDKELMVVRPSIEELMYFIIKGGEKTC